MKKIAKIWSAVLVFGFPVFVFAQSNSGKDLGSLAKTVVSYFQIAITVIISFAILSFVYNVARYFFTPDVSAEKKKEAGLYVLYSVIGFFVILSIWGLVAILRNSLKLPDYRPQWPFGGSNSSQTGVFGNPATTGGNDVFGNPATTGGNSFNITPLRSQ